MVSLHYSFPYILGLSNFSGDNYLGKKDNQIILEQGQISIQPKDFIK